MLDLVNKLFELKIDGYLSSIPKDIIFLDVHTSTSSGVAKKYSKLVKINVSIEALLDYIFQVSEFKVLLQR